MHVVGRVVDDAGNPVGGAKLTGWDQPTATATSDTAGAFDLSMMVKEQDRSFWFTAEKSGYETSELNRSVDGSAATAVRLHPIQRLSTGESIRAVLYPDDSACGYHWGFICRRVRVTASATGTLMVEIVSEGIATLGMPLGPVGFPQPLERRVTFPVNAGSEVSIDVAANSPLQSAAGFTIHTSVTP
jgi:hypothetical protein